MNYCKLYGKLIKDWVGYIDKLRSYAIEFGTPICREGNTIRMGNKAVLGFGMSRILECDVGVREATIHSHIVSDKASLQDHISAILSEVPRQCIIYKKDGVERIKCYEYSKFPKEELQKDLEIMKNVSDKIEYLEYMDKFDKKYLLCDEPIE